MSIFTYCLSIKDGDFTMSFTYETYEDTADRLWKVMKRWVIPPGLTGILNDAIHFKQPVLSLG
jgi:hypothetical protein